jgi:hypothetical protein
MKSSVIFLFVLLLSGCSNKSTNEDEAKLSATVAYAEPTIATKNSKEEIDYKDNGDESEKDLRISRRDELTEKIAAQIVKNASVQFQVSNVEASHLKIAALLARYHSYFGSDNKTTSSYQIENNMVIRVPSADFEKLMDELMKESVYTNYKTISAEDVTAEFVDVQARLKTKKEAEERYRTLLKQANKVSDILEVEDKLRVIREEIEAAEGRLKLLKDQVGYSTINLNAYQKLDYTPEPEIGFISNLTEAFARGWRSLVEFFISLVRVWPFVLLFGTALLMVLRKIRNRKK